VFVQPHFNSQVTRFTMIVFFVVSLVVLLIVGFITSYLDPSDPMVREYYSGNE
jgi:ABC-type antimicrobial peptide transport system permease subunit